MTQKIATCASVIPDGGPEWIKLMPAGPIDAADGRKWRLADPVAVADASAAAIDLVIDYEHQTDRSGKNGQPAPAAGWIKAIEARADGLWARVEWTDRARAHLAAREYRYLSPTFEVDKKNNVVRIIRAALTNNPAIHELPALAGAGAQKEGQKTMDEDQTQALATALGLPADADGPAIIAAAQSLVAAHAQGDAIATAARAALDLDEDAAPEIIAAAVEGLKGAVKTASDRQPDPARYVSLAAFEEQGAALKALQDNIAATAAATAVEKAMTAGKITPANKDWALALAASDAASFAAFVEKAPVVIAAGETAQPAGAKNAKDIAAKARAYQSEMASKGITVSTSDAVDHAMKGYE